MTNLVFKNGMTFEGKSFGAKASSAGEVVFSTGMMGYPESLTDPSYKGQILVLTYPLIGNYGIPDKKYWESEKIMVAGLVVSDYIDTPYHFQSKRTLSQWLEDEGIPGIEVKDTRFLTKMIREKGSLLGKIQADEQIDYYDPNTENLVAQVSTKTITKQGTGQKTILLIDCGAKKNIQRALLKRRVKIVTVPWDFDSDIADFKFDAVVVSNGPGDPKYTKETINNLRKLVNKGTPILGICLGHQLLSLALGGDTRKLKYGHRSQNQPCIMQDTSRCYITTQNHGFEVSKLPKGFKPWFVNANDGSNEGIIHPKKPLMSVQFHPEATPGPEDTEWIFDHFLKQI